MQKLISIFILFFIISCTVGPDYERPEEIAKHLKNFKNAPEDQGDEKISKWWTRLDDKASEEIVAKLINQNFDIEASYARLKQAIENSNTAGADLYPSLSAEFSGAKVKRPQLSQSASSGDPFNDFNLTLATSWQLDLFGKNRSNILGRTAELQANIFEIDALIQSLIANAINQRVAIAINQHRVELTENIIDSRQKTLEIVQRRYKSGIQDTSVLDLRLARENLLTAQAELPNVKANLEESIYDLDLLLGEVAGKDSKLDYKELSLIPPPQKITIPPATALLDRRPDLRASELRLVAANHDIGVAVADLYPDLTFTAEYGTNSREISNLLSSDQIAWSLLGSVTQKIFDGGRLRANIRLNEARAEELVADYSNDVLTAVKEVETALLREEALRKQLDLLEQNLTEIEHAERIANNRYSQGLGDILELLETQRRLWQVSQNTLDAQEASWNNRIALYLALGGDWDFGKEGLDIE